MGAFRRRRAPGSYAGVRAAEKGQKKVRKKSGHANRGTSMRPILHRRPKRALRWIVLDHSYPSSHHSLLSAPYRWRISASRLGLLGGIFTRFFTCTRGVDDCGDTYWIFRHKIYIDEKFVILAFHRATACLIRRSIGRVTACGWTLIDSIRPCSNSKKVNAMVHDSAEQLCPNLGVACMSAQRRTTRPNSANEGALESSR